MLKSVLLVEDNDQMRAMLRALVADLAEQIYECSDGTDAVTIHAAQRPTWVLMDLQMGTMDGLTATRHILAEFPAAQVMIVTDHDDEAMRAAAQAAGACAFVGKEDLLSVRQILTGERAPPKQQGN